jgi:hypothetical protein
MRDLRVHLLGVQKIVTPRSFRNGFGWSGAAIKESEALKAPQHEIAQEELKQAARSERDELFQKLVIADPHLVALLTNRDPVIKLPSAGTGEKGGGSGAGEFEGRYSPTFLRHSMPSLQNQR